MSKKVGYILGALIDVTVRHHPVTKLINCISFIYKNRKITKLVKHVSQNSVSMATSSLWHNNLSYQIISKYILDKVARFSSVWLNVEKVINFQSRRGHFSPPGLDSVKIPFLGYFYQIDGKRPLQLHFEKQLDFKGLFERYSCLLRNYHALTCKLFSFHFHLQVFSEEFIRLCLCTHRQTPQPGMQLFEYYC